MPAPLVLENEKEVVVAIEDNGFGDFKPYIIRSTISNNWAHTVNGDSFDRSYALAEKVEEVIYAGAPYLRQLKTGETIMSYQGTEGRPNKMAAAEMKVVIGNQEAREFNRKTAPFALPENKSGLWNSLSVLTDNTVIALTTTNAFSANGQREVWMIKGHVIAAFAAEKKTITVDGKQQEALWAEKFPVFVGHKSATALTSQVAYDDQFLYVLNRVKDGTLVLHAPDPEDNDGICIQIDAANKSYEKPDKGLFDIFLTANNQLMVREGKHGNWVARRHKAKIKYVSNITPNGYVQELAIPWSLLGGKPMPGRRIGFNVLLTENSGKGIANYREGIAASNANQPFSWMSLMLK